MASYAYWSLPMPVVAARGANISLNSILSLGFGSPPWTTGWLEADSSATIYNYAPSLPFSYWDPNAAAVGEWFVSNGATAFDSWTYANFANVSFTAGNAMGEYQHLDVTLSGPSNNPTGYIYYSFATVDPHVLSPTAGLGEPTAADIVASAYRFNAYYGNIPNTNDCHHIAEDVAAAAGATFPYRSANDTNPSANVDGGFWRVVYRGNVNGGVSNWHTLVQPGDIVRMHWDAAHGDGPHTTTILAVNPDGSMIVYDNGYYIGNSSYTGVHTVTYDQRTVAADITIYRLTSDGLYLSQGDDAGDAIPGTLFSDKLITGIGNDTSNGGRGNDVFQDAGGTNNFDGGGGRDKLIVNANFSATTTFTHSGTTWSIGGTGFSDTVRNIEVVQFNDRSVALQEDAHADFSGDGTSDIAFFNSAAGAVSFYEINPLGGYTWHNIGGVSTGYTPLAGDLNGDGIDDILWFNGTSVSAYLTNPAGGYAWRSIGSVSAGYTPLVGDFNGDGVSDVLWYNGTSVSTYLLNANGGYTWRNVGSVSGGNTPFVGDFNGDGTSDILWSNGTQVSTYLINPTNGSYTWRNIGSVSAGYTPIVGDFSGDGTSDIAWWNQSTGALSYYEINPSTGNYTWHNIGAVAAGYTPFVGDFNGDGKADIGWTNGSSLSYYDINPSGGYTWHGIGAVSAGYQVVK